MSLPVRFPADFPGRQGRQTEGSDLFDGVLVRFGSIWWGMGMGMRIKINTLELVR